MLWFYFLRMQPGMFRCSRAELVAALAAEGVEASAGYIGVPLYGEPVFQKHGFFAGRWPVKEFGLTAMDYSKWHCPEVEAILKTGIRLTIHEAMTTDYILGAAEAVRKVAPLLPGVIRRASFRRLGRRENLRGSAPAARAVAAAGTSRAACERNGKDTRAGASATCGGRDSW